jgi:3-(3-hydroxy-phenyl)propionate hydroxylase
VEASGVAQVHMGHRLRCFTDEGDHVRAVFETAVGEVTITGAFLCAADGASSLVRQSLGLSFTGMTYEDRFLLVATDFDFAQIYADWGAVNYIFDPLEWVIMLALPDLTRVVFRLRDEEEVAEALQEEALHGRLWRFMGGTHPFNILSTQVYRVHQRVAEQFRVGRVLLLGDAAHINNPMGGMGMNSGIHDAAMLADKLEQVWQGDDEMALDMYAQERRAVALEMIQAYTDKRYKDMAATDDGYRQQRDVRLRQQAADPVQSRAYLLTASMLAERI